MSKILKTVKWLKERTVSIVIGLLSGYLCLWFYGLSLVFIGRFYEWDSVDAILRLVEFLPVILTAMIVAIFLSRKLFAAFYFGFLIGYIYSFIFHWIDVWEVNAGLYSHWAIFDITSGCLMETTKVLVGLYLSSSINCFVANRGRFAISGLLEAMIASIALVFSIWNRGFSLEKRLLIFLLLTLLCAWTEWHYRRNRCV